MWEFLGIILKYTLNRDQQPKTENKIFKLIADTLKNNLNKIYI